MKKNYIGGYFELELDLKEELHKNALRLNSGRSCLNYLLKGNGYKKIYLPYYSCDSLLDIIKENNVVYEFYSLDKHLLPIFKKKIADNETFLFINFFNLHNNILPSLITKYNNIIIDNSQAFFSNPIKGADIFYSPRKFLGVADGGYLYTKFSVTNTLDKDYSAERSISMLLRSDGRLEEGYKAFLQNEEKFTSYGIQQMSELTQVLLSSINYDRLKEKRKRNFSMLHTTLQSKNQLKINNIPDGPMVYPFLIEGGGNLKKHLIHNKVFCAIYWKEVLDRVPNSSFEYNLVNNLVPLPIDQRYDTSDMKRIIDIIREYE